MAFPDIFRRYRGLRPWKSFYQRCSGGSSPSHVARWGFHHPGGLWRVFFQVIFWYLREAKYFGLDIWRVLGSWSVTKTLKIWFYVQCSIFKNYVILKMSFWISLNRFFPYLWLTPSTTTIWNEQVLLAVQGAVGISSQPVLQKLMQVPLKHT